MYLFLSEIISPREDFSPRELNQPGHFVAMILVFVKHEKIKIQKNVSETKTPGIRKQGCGLFAPDPARKKTKIFLTVHQW